MLRNGKKSHRELENLQKAKLRKLIRESYASVPYYKRLFDSAGLKPDHIEDIKDLSALPVTSKKQLQKIPLKEITNKRIDIHRCIQVKTSGSTGIPTELFYTKKDFSILNMNWIRPLLAHGARPWLKRLEITGPHNIQQRKNWYNHLGLWRKKSISLLKSPKEWVETLNEYEPHILYGYSGSLKLLSKYIQTQSIEHKNPDFIFGVSDLVDEECRELIESTFHKRLIDLYGAAEAGCIAWECQICKGYHINMDTVITEHIQGDETVEPGTPGNIVITNLHSFAMPIIRYDLGDIGIASLEKPICGNGMPLLEAINGRSDAFIVLPSGDRLSPMYFFSIMRSIKNIDRWKVVQKNIEHITVLVIPSSGFSSENVQRIKSRIRENISEKVHIEVKVVDEIPMEKSGKIRAVLSHVADNFINKLDDLG